MKAKEEYGHSHNSVVLPACISAPSTPVFERHFSQKAFPRPTQLNPRRKKKDLLYFITKICPWITNKIRTYKKGVLRVIIQLWKTYIDIQVCLLPLAIPSADLLSNRLRPEKHRQIEISQTGKGKIKLEMDILLFKIIIICPLQHVLTRTV